jgi:conjugative transfer signal peptidase TraF
VGAALLASGSLAYMLGLRINTSSSVPAGLWRETAIHRPLERGDIVAVCPGLSEAFRLAKARGYLGSGWCGEAHDEVIFKPIAAVPGDDVEVSSSAIVVNGTPLPHSARLEADSSGRPLPVLPSGLRVVGQGSVWLLSQSNAQSFDSRYFGAVETRQIRGLLEPVLVWDE